MVNMPLIEPKFICGVIQIGFTFSPFQNFKYNCRYGDAKRKLITSY